MSSSRPGLFAKALAFLRRSEVVGGDAHGNVFYVKRERAGGEEVRSESANGAGGESRASLHPSTTPFILSSPVSLPLDHSPHGAHPDRHEPVSL